MDINKLKGKIPEAVFNQIPFIMEKYDINTALRLSHFLGQAQHESGNFKVTSENLNYTAERLSVVFPKYFKGKNTIEYNRNPQKIANLVYGNRMGNGAETTGDGFKFRGRGFIQLTGKSNYIDFGKSIGEDITINPDLVSSTYALASAAWFFSKNGLNAIADKGITDDVITSVTKKINGGTIGLAERAKNTKDIYNLLKP